MGLGNVLLLISAFQGLILTLLVIFSPIFKSKANTYLGYSIGVLSFLLFSLFLDNAGLIAPSPILKLLTYIEWVFLFSVCFLLYCIHFINHDLTKSTRIKWLFIPIALSILFHLMIHLEYDFELYSLHFLGKEVLYDTIIGLERLGTYIFTAALMIWTRIILQKASKTTDINIIWLKKLWSFLCFILLSWILLFFIDTIVYDVYPQYESYVRFYRYILDIELSLLVYWISYTGLYKLRIANERQEILNLLTKKNQTKDKPSILQEEHKISSSHEFSENNAYFQALEQLLQEEFMYRDPNLSQEIVAQKLGISTGYLSQIINKITEKNFTAYINSYRVEETKRMLLDEKFDKYSVLSIGLESGFNSKTTFYTAFKKDVGCTPSQFKKQHK